MTRKYKAVFMGTPDFAVQSLRVLYELCDVQAAVTQKDKPRGRGNKLSFCAVKEEALALGIPVLQPGRARNAAFCEQLEKLKPDVIVVAAYGQILPERILNIPRFGCINVHASILPKYRGASPIQAAVLNGDNETGISIMRMDAGLDTGDIISVRTSPIGADETCGELFERLSVLGGEALAEALPAIFSGQAEYTKQDEAKATYVSMITKESGRIDWTKSAREIHNLVRAMNPWPLSHSTIQGREIKITKTKPAPDTNPQGLPPGSIIKRGARAFAVTGGGTLEILEIKPGSGKAMGLSAYLNGRRDLTEQAFG